MAPRSQEAIEIKQKSRKRKIKNASDRKQRLNAKGGRSVAGQKVFFVLRVSHAKKFLNTRTNICLIDSDLSEEMPLAAVKVVQQKPAESPTKEESPSIVQPPGTPPSTHPTAGSSHKRGARSNRRGKGRNQYTRDRDQDDESPARSMSRDIQKGDEATTTGHPKSSVNEHKTSKAKASMANKMSLLDMKRRVAAIMEFISRTQVDLAAEAPHSQSTSGRETPQEKPESSQPNGHAVNGDTPDPSDMNRFKDLNCMEMMDVLTRDMVRWQNQYS